MSIRVGINGYGVIGKRVADAVAMQPDMELAGVADVTTDYRIAVAHARPYSIFGATGETRPRRLLQYDGPRSRPAGAP